VPKKEIRPETLPVSGACIPEGGCRVEAIVSMDERGQILFPKDLRERAGIRPGDRLAVTSWERNGQICCVTLTKVEGLTDMVRNALGPVLKELL